jgi:hypothetical protein
MGLEGGLKGRDELLKLVQGQAGQIQQLCGTGLHIAALHTGHTWRLLSVEAQHTIKVIPI